MAASKKLKVYRTPIGFHDAYVAAPSQKAALEAWGSSHNLFARGIAEIVEDPALTKEPLDNPGRVIKRSRGTTAEQIAALLPAKQSASEKGSDDAPDVAKPESRSRRAAKPKPRPSHDAVDAAEADFAELADRHAEADRALKAEQAALDRRRAELEKAQAAEREKAQAALDRAEAKYAAAIRKWKG
ncbi:HlyD family secretion protein [Sphingomonas immobilis]|uniref:Cell envelope biogenesis protein TolA n=1 Tax=Sphingomonas immobilis TaxID=3063997 RepID=A0ABT9A4A3_9SPHN|nr:hypothetical protein [Sphingomonas sp. CA1-15]MDO7843562.1 hypothetical protein [Sphingomonas sp. CA1-15]